MAGSFSWIRRLFVSLSKEDKELAAGIASITGRTPNNLDVYKLAVRHSSFSSGASGEHNERLEFLGDAILGAVVAEYLFKKFPKRNEGFMTEIRSRLVNGEALGQLASKIGLDRLIQYEGRRKQPHTHRSMNGDAMEALIGAYFLDFGFEATKTFILDRLIKPNYDLNQVVESDHNHKSRMIEWAQKNGRKLSFEIAADSGRGNKDFVANVVLDGKLFASGSGFSKKKAEQSAAMAAINKIKGRSEQSESLGQDRRGSRQDQSQGRNEQRRSQEPRSDREQRQERPERPDRPERPERQERPDRQPRSDRNEPRQDRAEKQERREAEAERQLRAEAPHAEQEASRRQEDQPQSEPRPGRDNRRNRPGRVNQEELYNEASPIGPVEDAGITATEPRPERVPRERPARRERPPRRKLEREGEANDDLQDDANGIVPSLEPVSMADELVPPHEPNVKDTKQPQGSRDENPVSDREFKEIFQMKDRRGKGRPGREERSSKPDQPAEPSENRVSTEVSISSSLEDAPKPMEPSAPAAPFVVNKEVLKPKAVEEVLSVPVAPPVSNSSSKRKWVNVTGAGEAPSPKEPQAPTGKVTPREVGQSPAPAATEDMARKAFDSISSEADAFMTQQRPVDESKPAGAKEENSSAEDGAPAA